jgi:hypothetical protein
MEDLLKELLRLKLKAFEDAMSDDGRIWKASQAKYDEMLSSQNKYTDKDVFQAYKDRELIS